MKRDCGEGELIPVKFLLIWCVGKSDKELKKTISSPTSGEFEELLKTLPPFSDVRMYAEDKKEYQNCVRSAHVNGEVEIVDGVNRLAELGEGR